VRGEASLYILEVSNVAGVFADPRLVELLLDTQDHEFQDGVDPQFIWAVITSLPEGDLWDLGSALIAADDDDRVILGIRLIRELPRHKLDAKAALESLLAEVTSDDVLFWILSAFAFVPSDGMTGRIAQFSTHGSSEIRDVVAGALPNELMRTGDAEYSIAIQCLSRLSHDPDPEVRFSATFELGTLFSQTHDEYLRAMLIDFASGKDSDPRIQAIATEALKEI
jgi:hypothetical protein